MIVERNDDSDGDDDLDEDESPSSEVISPEKDPWLEARQCRRMLLGEGEGVSAGKGKDGRRRKPTSGR